MAAVRPHKGVTHSEASGFDRMLLRFARPERPRYGVAIARGEDGLDPLREVLREIDETMLPRQITLLCRPGGVLKLIVSNRRLLSIQAEGGRVAAAGETPAEVARVFANTFLKYIEGCQETVLQPPERLGAFESPYVSCSAPLLAMAAGLDGCGFEDAVPDGDFFGAARGMAVAWLEAGRDMFVSATGGTEEGTQRLLQVLQAIAKGGGRSRRPQIGAQVPQCVFIPLGGAETLLVATEKDLCFLALAPDARSAGLAETWHVYSSVSGRR